VAQVLGVGVTRGAPRHDGQVAAGEIGTRRWRMTGSAANRPDQYIEMLSVTQCEVLEQGGLHVREQ
jgi:hypothetical protein